MTELKVVLGAAETAKPGERIEFRDSIAAYGASAIEAMKVWLEDARLGAFAVRVLARIAEDQGNRRAVLTAFASVDHGRLPRPVASDIADVIRRIEGRSSTGTSRAAGSPRPPREEWPGSRVVSPLERRFHDAMLDIFKLAGEATRRVRPDGSVARGYWASRFLQAVKRRGGPDYARQLMRAKGTTEGFGRLAEEGKLELTVEALVLRPEFEELFTDSDRLEAARRLGGRQFG